MAPIARPVNPTSVGQLGGARGSRVYRGKGVRLARPLFTRLVETTQ